MPGSIDTLLQPRESRLAPGAPPEERIIAEISASLDPTWGERSIIDGVLGMLLNTRHFLAALRDAQIHHKHGLHDMRR